jgi:hypothetical protein
LQTSMLYQKPNEDMLQNYNRAILGKHVATPPKIIPERKKRKKKKHCKNLILRLSLRKRTMNPM